MQTKRIGIVGWATGPNSFGATVPYLDLISQYGTPVILSPSKHIDESLDLLVLPGGKDVFSKRYGQVPSFNNSDPDLYKEYFAETNLSGYIEAGIPIFGICLGLQQIQVHFGGELMQNCYHPSSEKFRGELIHEIDFEPKFEKLRQHLYKGLKTVKVNSLHHQGVYMDDLAHGLVCVASHEGIVEVLMHDTLPIAAVQFHPEEMGYSAISHFFITDLLEKKKIKELTTNAKA